MGDDVEQIDLLVGKEMTGEIRGTSDPCLYLE